MLETCIFSFSLNVFYSSPKKFNFSAKFNLSSANAFNLVQSKILLLGKNLRVTKTQSGFGKGQVSIKDSILSNYGNV